MWTKAKCQRMTRTAGSFSCCNSSKKVGMSSRTASRLSMHRAADEHWAVSIASKVARLQDASREAWAEEFAVLRRGDYALKEAK